MYCKKNFLKMCRGKNAKKKKIKNNLKQKTNKTQNLKITSF